MKTTLVLQKDQHSYTTMWTETKLVDVEIPFDWEAQGYHIIGAAEKREGLS